MSHPKTPQSPEEYPAPVREALHQEGVSHEGEARPPDEQATMSEHMGAEETEPTPVTPPMNRPDTLIEGNEATDLGIDPREELTGG